MAIRSTRNFLMIALVVASTAVFAQTMRAHGAPLRMLDRFEPGLWELKVRESAQAFRRLCLDSGRPLIQLRHPASLCRSVVVQDEEQAVTVHYTCPGAGYGRTHIRMENARLAQIDSQGVADRYPFDFVAEARKVGPCRAN